MLKGLITAIRTLTVIPVPGQDARNFASSLPWFPIVGLFIGSILYGAAFLAGIAFANPWNEGIALVIVGLSIILTRAIHVDGLSDWADGFGGGNDKQKILLIMKDPHKGVFGVIAIVFTILTKWVCIFRLLATHASFWIIGAYIISRTMQVEMAASLPYARIESGTACPFVNNARIMHRITALIIALGLVVWIFGIEGIAFIAGSWIACTLFGLWCRKRIGGVTGDTLGACSEIIETTVLLASSFLVFK
jgi:adenosylcobinamide-GDP ribazoletransferase